MIQDIEPRKYDITFKNVKPKNSDFMLLFSSEKILMKLSAADMEKDVSEDAEFLTFSAVKDEKQRNVYKENAMFLFSIDDHNYFSVNDAGLIDSFVKDSGVVWQNHMDFRGFKEHYRGFAAISAVQIMRWHSSRKFCGRCGAAMKDSRTERAMICQSCDYTEYPKISPAVIVGIVDGNRLLLTRYADRPFKKYALIAGFSEIGETLEDTIRREVMEEVGLQVKDMVYYKSQPWSFSDSLLVGFFARLDGSDKVKLDDDELAEATWFEREDVPVYEETVALTAEMIRYFVSEKNVFKK